MCVKMRIDKADRAYDTANARYMCILQRTGAEYRPSEVLQELRWKGGVEGA